MVKLSVAIIVKNESSEILECLESVNGADEIVIVDTGSTDDTCTLIEAYNGDNVVLVKDEYVWQDDFAHARNYANNICTGDWILTISADGRMTNINSVMMLIDDLEDSVDAISITQQSRYGNTHKRTMLHKRMSDVRWQGAVHENLAMATHTQNEPDIIMRYGYSESHKFDPDRNLRILLKDSGSARTSYYLGVEFFERKQFQTAVLWFTECSRTSTFIAERADAWLYIAKCRWKMSEGDAAREAAAKAIINNPNFKEAHLKMAEMVWDKQKVKWQQFANLATNEDVLFVRNT